jgi:hypothetical protein
MLNLKKTAVAVLALSSSAVFAGAMGPVCSAVPVTMPCESNAWVVGGKALYLNANSGYQNANVVSSTGGSYNTSASTNYGWGFNVFGAMKYGTGRDILLSWNHINNAFHRTFSPQSITGNQALYTSYQSYISDFTLTSGGVRSAPKWDAVNMEFGQRVDFSEVTFIRPSFGWQWARMGSNNVLSAAGSVTTVSTTDPTTSIGPTNYAFSRASSPDFNGFGPRIALDGVYRVFAGLDIYAKGGFGLLAGYNKSSAVYTNSTSTANGESVTAKNSTVTTPALFDGKLGIDYTYETQGFGSLTLDVDWAWYSYVGPFKSQQGNALAQGSAANFTLTGLEFGLTWAGDSV